MIKVVVKKPSYVVLDQQALHEGTAFLDHSPTFGSENVYIVVREQGQTDPTHILRVNDATLYTWGAFIGAGGGRQIEILTNPYFSAEPSRR